MNDVIEKCRYIQANHLNVEKKKPHEKSAHKINEMNQNVQNDKLLYFDRVVQVLVVHVYRTYQHTVNCLTIFKKLF